MFLEILQSSQENTCARDFFLIKVAGLRNLESCVIFENTYFYRTSSVAASIKKKTKQQMEITALENES